VFELRDYQARTVDRAFRIPDQPIFVAPTGSGKTVMQAFIAKEAMNRGYHTAILTPRVEIFTQTHDCLEEVCGIENVATLRAGKSWNSYKPVHVVSWPTLVSKMKKGINWMPKVEVVMVDESHLSLAPKVKEILEYYQPRAKVIGFTATPARSSGTGLGDFYSEIVPVTTVPKLIAEGFLNPNEYWAGSYADVTGVGLQNGDYNSKELGERSMPLVGDVVDNWLRLAKDRHTIVFVVNIKHGKALLDRFLEVGVNADFIHSKMQPPERAKIVERFKAGQIQVLINVTIASYGFDSPTVDCIVLARRTKSIVLHLQMLGRSMRPGDLLTNLIEKLRWISPSWWAGEKKRPTMVLDHADNVRTLGRAEDLYRWQLKKGKKACTNVTLEKTQRDGTEREIRCEKCSYLITGRRDCPQCGHEAPIAGEDVATVDADLVRISEFRNKPVGEGFPKAEIFYRMLLYHQRETGVKPGFVAAKFKQKVGDWPPREWVDLAGIPPDAHVRNWLLKEKQNYARRASYARAAAKRKG